MAEPEEYKVDKNLCIDCNACYTTFSEIFKQVPWEGETKAEAYAPTEKGKYNPWDVLGCCPTDAISKIGEMPPKPEKGDSDAALPPLEDLGPWEARWERVKHLHDSKWELMKRYGMAAVLSEEKDKYVIKMEFPDKTPIHILKYKMGLPDVMPDYKYEVTINPEHTGITIAAWMQDLHLRNLCGKINSFPDRFRRQFNIGTKIDIVRQTYRNKILTLELRKVPAGGLH